MNREYQWNEWRQEFTARSTWIYLSQTLFFAALRLCAFAAGVHSVKGS
jgi:hypothetical protein